MISEQVSLDYSALKSEKVQTVTQRQYKAIVLKNHEYSGPKKL